MANVENRAAEHGSQFIADTETHTFAATHPAVALRILEPTVIFSIETLDDTIGADYYEGEALDIDTPIILANVTSLKLTSGAVQAIFS